MACDVDGGGGDLGFDGADIAVVGPDEGAGLDLVQDPANDLNGLFELLLALAVMDDDSLKPRKTEDEFTKTSQVSEDLSELQITEMRQEAIDVIHENEVLSAEATRTAEALVSIFPNGLFERPITKQIVDMAMGLAQAAENPATAPFVQDATESLAKGEGLNIAAMTQEIETLMHHADLIGGLTAGAQIDIHGADLLEREAGLDAADGLSARVDALLERVGVEGEDLSVSQALEGALQQVAPQYRSLPELTEAIEEAPTWEKAELMAERATVMAAARDQLVDDTFGRLDDAADAIMAAGPDAVVEAMALRQEAIDAALGVTLGQEATKIIGAEVRALALNPDASPGEMRAAMLREAGIAPEVAENLSPAQVAAQYAKHVVDGLAKFDEYAGQYLELGADALVLALGGPLKLALAKAVDYVVGEIATAGLQGAALGLMGLFDELEAQDAFYLATAGLLIGMAVVGGRGMLDDFRSIMKQMGDIVENISDAAKGLRPVTAGAGGFDIDVPDNRPLASVSHDNTSGVKPEDLSPPKVHPDSQQSVAPRPRTKPLTPTEKRLASELAESPLVKELSDKMGELGVRLEDLEINRKELTDILKEGGPDAEAKAIAYLDSKIDEVPLQWVNRAPVDRPLDDLVETISDAELDMNRKSTEAVQRTSPGSPKVEADRSTLRTNLKNAGIQVGKDQEAHHLIPHSLRDHEILNKLRSLEGGWDHNNPRNGIALDKDHHGRFPGHTNYNWYVESRLEIMEIEFRNGRIAEADLQSKMDELLAELRDKVTPDQLTPDGRPPGLR
ncbi:AHH domain-containing protein [Cognatiyoonia sp. IB215446]|uniref:AHH domain-containing protein n=1 Tax=Cognatiyoonia sp. IB215446 TaxID=3097355 RepID=UPI002A0EA23C|nr:AHH domain-containing protein [Cognatiyoonia sp. IB215446]MDX8349405.1 AHH domain-containing protein [Cognatiyoonia sp. IB215446]